MDRKALLEQFELELRQAMINYENGNTFSREDLRWGTPLHIAEAPGEGYRATEF